MTIEFEALKAQLTLLGHQLPDEQVAAILKDMNIDFVGFTSATATSTCTKALTGEEPSSSMQSDVQASPLSDPPSSCQGPPLPRNFASFDLQGISSPAHDTIGSPSAATVFPLQTRLAHFDETTAWLERVAEHSASFLTAASRSINPILPTSYNQHRQQQQLVWGSGDPTLQPSQLCQNQQHLLDNEASSVEALQRQLRQHQQLLSQEDATLAASVSLSSLSAHCCQADVASGLSLGRSAAHGGKSAYSTGVGMEFERDQVSDGAGPRVPLPGFAASVSYPAYNARRSSLSGGAAQVPSTAVAGCNLADVEHSGDDIGPLRDNFNSLHMTSRAKKLGMEQHKHSQESSHYASAHNTLPGPRPALAVESKQPTAAKYSHSNEVAYRGGGVNAGSRGANMATPAFEQCMRAGRPVKYDWAEQLRSGEGSERGGSGGGAGVAGTRRDTSPTASSVISLGRSSIAGSCRSSSSRAGGGAKKVDRVARYRELAQTWSKDTFLKTSDIAGTGSRISSKPAPRPPQNFHQHFAALHASEAAESARVKREARMSSAADAQAASAYVAPTSKRRDELRWATRMRLQERD